jgi:hypothetical protein
MNEVIVMDSNKPQRLTFDSSPAFEYRNKLQSEDFVSDKACERVVEILTKLHFL